MRIGVDLGGTKIEAVALAPDGAELARRRVATPGGTDADRPRAIVAAIGALVRGIEAELGPGTVGVGTPGSMAGGVLRNSNTVCLNGLPLEAMLSGELGRPVRVANDANCFALSEATDGAAAGRRVVFGVILGTGVGGGVVVDGRVLAGANGLAGEWGHNPLPWPDADEPAACYCGKRGCIETYLSGAGLARDYARRSGRALGAARAEGAGAAPSASPAEIAARAATDAEAAAAVDRYAERLAKALASVINVLDPDAIVLGGGLSNIAALYPRVPAAWSRWAFATGGAIATPLLAARWGDSSGVRGAAWLWPGP